MLLSTDHGFKVVSSGLPSSQFLHHEIVSSFHGAWLLLTNQGPAFWSRDSSWPIRGQQGLVNTRGALSVTQQISSWYENKLGQMKYTTTNKSIAHLAWYLIGNKHTSKFIDKQHCTPGDCNPRTNKKGRLLWNQTTCVHQLCRPD